MIDALTPTKCLQRAGMGVGVKGVSKESKLFSKEKVFNHQKMFCKFLANR